MERKKSPVFVVGCHRSGTNLLYDTLLSSGGFAIFRASWVVHDTLIPLAGDPRVLKNRRRLLDLWMQSGAFPRSGLEAEMIRERVLSECRTGSDFIRLVMDEVARRQGVDRWAAYNPDNVLFMPQIKRELPDALFVHIIRDGRDIAVSLTKMGGLRPLPWDKKRSELATALYWEWTVRKGRADGERIKPAYLEVHYEDLIGDPHRTLARLSEFIGHDLDYERIQNAGLGRVADPNSSFKDESKGPYFNPVNRWKSALTRVQVADLEALIGGCLQEFGYPPSTSGEERRPGPLVRLMHPVYPVFFSLKRWLKSNTPLGRLATFRTLPQASGQPGANAVPAARPAVRETGAEDERKGVYTERHK
ncbi:MAG TPA: sulfotransferase [Terriglobia bacterium]|nr:sulfotransferase [Terriglobia bacterium]